MKSYNTYNIKENDIFNIVDFPKVELELMILKNAVADIPELFREMIIISYVKNHSIKTEWIEANPSLATLITGSQYSTLQTQRLFESSKTNLVFSNALEAHIKLKLTVNKNNSL